MTSEPAELAGKQRINESDRGDEGAPPSPSGYRTNEVRDSGTASLARAIGDAGEDAQVGTAKSSETASKIADVAKDAAKAAFQAVSAQASELASNVTDELAKSGENQKRRGAETMRTFAGAIEHAAGDLDEESPRVARQFRVAARKVEDLSETLRDHSIKELFTAATDLARRQPLSFFAGAVVVGFALSRFLKSSGATRPETSARSETASPSAPDLQFPE